MVKPNVHHNLNTFATQFAQTNIRCILTYVLANYDVSIRYVNLAQRSKHGVRAVPFKSVVGGGGGGGTEGK